MENNIETRTGNSIYKKLAFLWLNKALFIVSISVVVENFILRNRKFFATKKRYFFRFNLIIVVLLCFSKSIAQIAVSGNFPKDYFRSPLDIELKLAGTFCELRSNHFHTGIDIKTNEKSGLPVLAVADGYISRIKISATGYGNAIYVTHPNGYTSVYGHLESFSEPLKTYLKNEQYKAKRFEIELLPNFNQFFVKKGQVIATSGNSGSSGGPHLHFEIRNTKTENAINPLLFGIKIKDQLAPILYTMKLYALDNGYYSTKGKTFPLIFKENQYSCNSIIELEEGNYGIALEGQDKMEESKSNLGFYQIQFFNKISKIFQWKADEVSFDQIRYINAFMDFDEKEINKKNFYNCFRLPGNPLNSINTDAKNGCIYVKEKDTVKISAIITDFNGNKTNFNATLVGTKSKPKVSIFLYDYNKSTKFIRNGIEIQFEKGNFYDKLNLNYLVTNSLSNKGIYSLVHTLSNYNIPCQKSNAIFIEPIGLTEKQKDKALIVLKNNIGIEQPIISKWENGKITGKIKTLGTYYIRIDTIAPTIKFVNYSTKTKSFSGNSVSAIIKDDLSDILSINGFIDGKWVLLQYDKKNNHIQYIMDEKCLVGKHKLEVVIVDNKLNENRTTLLFENI